MRNRTNARECALQLLYQKELHPGQSDEWLLEFWSQLKEERGKDAVLPEIRDYAELLVFGVADKQKEIDALIESTAEHWAIDRMALVDRNVLRIGTYEIAFNDDIPDKVAINEAIELAKKFGDAESSRFVNGVLDKVAQVHNQ